MFILNQKRRLPIGISDFKKIREGNYYYVDKSLFIEDVINGGEAILITRPRRFGKTLNQLTLKYFFDMDEDNKKIFEGLKITDNKEITDKYLNNYPVIYLTFKDIKEQSWDRAYEKIVNSIIKEVERYLWVLENEEVTKINRKYIETIYEKEGSQTDYEEILKNLSEIVYKAIGKKMILLIDEYDTPIQASHLNGYYEDMINFMRGFLSGGLKDNSYLEKAVLTGILRVAKESIFSGVNNLDVLTILDKSMGDKFGLLKGEVIELLDYYGLKYEKDGVVKWYDGYNFGEVDIYNPFSIINLAKNSGELKSYWVNTSGNELIKNIIKKGNKDIKEKIETLLEGGSIKSRIEEGMVYKDLSVGNEHKIWTLFLFSGYLKWINLLNIEDRDYELKIPNQETVGFYKNVILDILKESRIELGSVLLSLVREEIESFKENFRDIVINSLSYFDISGKNPEMFYHGLILGMVVSLKEKYIVESNRESGYGRADVLLIPRDKNDKGIVMEFKKKYSTDKSLLESAIKGYEQIENRKYEEEIKKYGVEEVIKVSIAFEGKKIEIVTSFDNIDEMRREYEEKKEKLNKRELSEGEKIAKSLLDILDIETIAEKTGLSVERVNELKDMK